MAKRDRGVAANARRKLRRLAFRAPFPLRYDETKTVLLAGTPRSGTTWVGQLLATMPRSAVVFEPMRGESARAAGIGWHTIEGRTIDDARAIDFLRRALRGEVRTGWTMRENSVRSLVSARTWIMKEVRVNRVLPWIVRHFGLTRGVLLIRDPYAVISSQIGFTRDDVIDAWLGSPRVRPPQVLIDAYPWLAEITLTDDDAVGQLALQWALDQLVPLADPHPSWVVLGYEAVQRDPVAALATVFDRWGVPLPEGLETRAAIPSSVSRKASPRAWSRESAWSDEFGAADRRRVEDVCRAVGLELSDGGDGAPCARLRSDLAVAHEVDR